MESNDMYTIPLTSGPMSIDLVGTKAASLATLLSHGIKVPPGFVVNTIAHRRFLAVNHLDANPVPQEAIRAAVWPTDLSREIRSCLDHFSPDTRWAVRSSGTLEDLAEASFAGQYDTFLDVSSDEVLPRIQDCWASLASAHAQSYARDHGFSVQDTAMGVIVQMLVNADAAGVSFSRHPVTGHDSIVINAAYGLGEAVVSGMVTPDSFEVDKETHAIASQLGFKESQVVLAPQGGTAVVETPLDQQNSFCLNKAQVIEIADVTHRLEILAGFPVDVEWAFDKGTLYCLQMRPITLIPSGGMHS